LELPEYNFVVSLLEKGIGIHHSGMLAILREIVELMISKKYIKFLFATESFAIGLDCPIKTAVFLGLTKFDGSSERHLMAHEYTQMAGRAGRRGIDTIGHVVHCNNLFHLPSATDYKSILGGKPQKLVSKFRISYPLVLSLLKNGKNSITDITDFIRQSMSNGEILEDTESQKRVLHEFSEKYAKSEQVIQALTTSKETCEQYITAEDGLKTAVNKKRKEFERALESLSFDHRFIKSDVLKLRAHNRLKSEYESEYEFLTVLERHIENQTDKICDVLISRGFILAEETEKTLSLSPLGKIASNIAEIHPLIAAQYMDKYDYFADFTVEQIIGLLACFTDVKVNEDQRNWNLTSDDPVMKSRFQKLVSMYKEYEILEEEYKMNTGIDYLNALNYDMPDFAMEWALCESEKQCKCFIQSRLAERGISIGDFTKAVMKISTISKEWISMCEEQGKIECMHKLSQIDAKILKYITTSQSLYV